MTEGAATGPDHRTGVRRPVEIACDESGSEGENLLDGVTTVFAHASVRLDTDIAAGIVAEVRRRIGSPALEYKANHLLRSKHRPVLEWLLAPAGPLRPNARVFLVEKAFFGVARLIDVLRRPEDEHDQLPDAEAAALAGTLCREGSRTYDEQRWRRFLRAGNALLRTRGPDDELDDPVAEFTGAVSELRRLAPDGPTAPALAMLADAREAGIAFRTRRASDPQAAPVLDPLIPAVVRSVSAWNVRERAPVAVVHDRQRALTKERIARMTRLLDRTNRGAFAGLRQLDSRRDPRVQLADFLAGVARRIAEDRLTGDGDEILVELLRPHVEPDSVWGDPRSWPGPQRAGPDAESGPADEEEARREIG